MWALFIAVLCGMPGTSLPHVSWLELLSFDKVVHASLFFILTTLSLAGVFNKYRKDYFTAEPIYFVTAFMCVCYGGVLELLQGAFFVARSADAYDFIANSFGIIIAAIYFNKTKNYLPYTTN